MPKILYAVMTRVDYKSCASFLISGNSINHIQHSLQKKWVEV